MPRIPLTVGRREPVRGEFKGVYAKSARKPSGDPKFMRIGSAKRLEMAWREADTR